MIVFEFLEFAVNLSKSKMNMKMPFLHKNSIFTTSVCSNLFRIPEMRTDVVRHLLKPGTTLTEAEARKIEKYRELIDNGYIFQPVASEVQGS